MGLKWLFSLIANIDTFSFPSSNRNNHPTPYQWAFFPPPLPSPNETTASLSSTASQTLIFPHPQDVNLSISRRSSRPHPPQTMHTPPRDNTKPYPSSSTQLTLREPIPSPHPLKHVTQPIILYEKILSSTSEDSGVRITPWLGFLMRVVHLSIS